MSEARSLTPLSETDYEAIAGAVMETARGRWFMAEFAKRNRQADTAQLLSAIGRIERVVGIGTEHASAPDPSLREAAALIGDLRLDLERISGRSDARSSGLAHRIEGAAGAIVAATESVQETSWSLREAGADNVLCDTLDHRATEIYAATAVIEATSQQIAKIADTIAMLDSSLRAFAEGAQEAAPVVVAAYHGRAPLGLLEAGPLGAYDDIEIIEIDEAPVSVLAERRVSPRPASELKLHASSIVGDDIVFADIGELAEVEAKPLAPAAPVAGPTSEMELRGLDSMPAEQKLAYFA